MPYWVFSFSAGKQLQGYVVETFPYISAYNGENTLPGLLRLCLAENNKDILSGLFLLCSLTTSFPVSVNDPVTQGTACTTDL